MAQGTLWVAQWAVKHGLSANAGLRIAQEMGVGVRRDTWLRMFGEVRNRYAARAASLGALATAIPQATDITGIPTHSATGYMQYVDVWVRDKGSGVPRVRPQAFVTDRLLSHGAAIDLVVGRYNSAIDRAKVAPGQWGTLPDEVVIGGMYVATIEFIPSAET